MSAPMDESGGRLGESGTVRTLVCGSRTWAEGQALWNVLRGFDLPGQQLHIIHGGAKGADESAGAWASANGAECSVFPADWDQYGKRAGYVRNAQMLSEGKPDLVLAFVDKPLAASKGTAMMVDLARKAGVVTYVIEGGQFGRGAADHG